MFLSSPSEDTYYLARDLFNQFFLWFELNGVRKWKRKEKGDLISSANCTYALIVTENLINWTRRRQLLRRFSPEKYVSLNQDERKIIAWANGVASVVIDKVIKSDLPPAV